MFAGQRRPITPWQRTDCSEASLLIQHISERMGIIGDTKRGITDQVKFTSERTAMDRDQSNVLIKQYLYGDSACSQSLLRRLVDCTTICLWRKLDLAPPEIRHNLVAYNSDAS